MPADLKDTGLLTWVVIREMRSNINLDNVRRRAAVIVRKTFLQMLDLTESKTVMLFLIKQ